MFLTSILILTGLYYITGFPAGILLSKRVAWMYDDAGVKHPFGLHILLSAIPWLGFWLLCLVLRVEADSYSRYCEQRELEQYRAAKEDSK